MKDSKIKFRLLFFILLPFFSIAEEVDLKAISDSIFEHAVQLYNQEDYNTAISEFQKCDVIDEQYMDPVLNRREYSKIWISRCYYLLGDEEQAKQFSNYYKIEPINRKLTEESDSLSLLAYKSFLDTNYKQAIQYGLACLEKEKKLIGENNYYTANSFFFIGECYLGIEDYNNALFYHKKGLSIRQQLLGNQSIDYLTSLHELFSICYVIDEVDDAIKYGEEAKVLYSKIIGTNDLTYCNLLEDLYLLFIEKENNSKAIQLGEELIKLIEELKGKNSEDYVKYLNSLANQYLNIDDTHVIRIRKELIPLLKNAYGTTSERYLFNLDVLSGLSYRANNYNDCIKYGQEFLLSNNIDNYDTRSLKRIYIDVALSYINQKKYHDAIAPLLKVNELLNDTSDVYLGLLSYCYEFDNNHRQASIWFDKYINVLQSKISDKKVLNDAIEAQSFAYEKSGDYLKALENRLIHLNPTNVESPIEKAYSLKNLAYIYYKLGVAKKAVQYGEEALGLLSKNDSIYPLFLDYMALFYSGCGYYDKAISYEKESIRLDENIYGLNYPALASSYSNLSSFYYETGNYDLALCHIKKSLEIQETQMTDNNLDFQYYVTTLNNYAECLRIKGNYILAKEIFEKALDVCQDSLRRNDNDYATTLTNYALLLTDMGDFKTADVYLKESLSITKQALGDNSKGYAEVMNNLVSHYNQLGDYKNAFLYSDSAICIIKGIVGELHPSYANALTNLALVQANSGDYKNAIYNTEKACEIKKQLYGTDGYKYLSSLGDLATYYSAIGDYQVALKLNLLVEEAKRSILGETNPKYLTTLNNLAVNYSNLGDITKAKELYEKVLNIQQISLGSNHPDCANTMYNLAHYYMDIKDYDTAIQYIKAALQIYQDQYGENHPDVAFSLSALSRLYLMKQEFEQALLFDKQALEIRKGIFGEYNLQYFMSLNNVSLDYYVLKDYVSAWQYKKQCCFNLKNYYSDNLYYFDSNSRESFWNKYAYIFDSDIPYLCLNTPEQVQDQAFLYDYSALFSKGLLLNIESNIDDHLLESNDPEIIRLSNEIQQKKNFITKLYERPVNERYIDVDSLAQEMRRQEKELLRIYNSHNDFVGNINITWNDVQKHLNKNDIAIEFLSPYVGNDSVIYIALTVNKNDTTPKMFTLFEKKQIDSILVKDYYTSDALYNLIWKPLEKELEGKENIYFSPTGALYNIGIEYLPIDNNENIADRYNLIRLSSTRELVINKGTSKPTKAALYGGLLYNIDPEVIQEDNLTNNYKPKYAMMMRGLEDSLNVRGDFSQLGYTLREVESIDDLLTRDNLNTKLFTKYNGTEESFKSLDGQRVNILHLATHGSYIPEEKAAKKRDENNYRFIRLGEENKNTVIEDQSLTRSFLVMSGGNMLIHGDSIPAGLDDGILTAQEISKIDLRGLDLVVLSACETALGDITSEGVMGLQRGFKKAGAQTIVMSLWKVADEPTQQFMTEFYRLLTEGNSKRQSFKGAQQYLRELYPKQQEKPYWSAFIMLD
jgi:CHAT domain-containing protein/Tfp pilus assembly protein PilF